MADHYKFWCDFGWYLYGNRPEPKVLMERINPGGFPMEYKFDDGPEWLKIVTTTHLAGDPEENGDWSKEVP